MSRVAWLGVALMSGTLLGHSPTAAGQDADVLGRWYDAGVHAYFAGDFLQAQRQLTRTITGGTRDPRAYYFRALTYLATGRTTAAEADLARGAKLEVEDRDGVYPISRSLERIQGRARLVIENYRRRAEIDQYERQRRQTRQRYEQLRRREQDVLRRQITVPLASLASPTVAVAAKAEPASQADSRPAAAKAVTPPPRAAGRAEAGPATAGTAAGGPQQPATAPRVIAVPDEQKIESSRLGQTLSRIFARALAGDEQASSAKPQNTPANSQQPPAAATAAPADARQGDRPAAAAKPAAADDPFADDELTDVAGKAKPRPNDAAASGQKQDAEQDATGAKSAATDKEKDPVTGTSSTDEKDPFGAGSDADASDDPFAE